MADEEKIQQEQVEKEARAMGWLPKEEYKGKPETWAEASAFIERGRSIMPILQENNRRLLQTVSTLNVRLAHTEGAVKAANAAVAALEESHEKDVQEQVKAAREGLKKELEAASRDGDHAAVADLTDKIADLSRAEAAAVREDKDPKDGNGEDHLPTIPPALQAEISGWFAANPDYKTGRRYALAMAIADEFRTSGDARAGAAFLDAVAEEVEKTLGETRGGRPGKVNGDTGGHNAGGGRGGDGGKTYTDLPDEAKKACDKMAGKLVGEGRAHKDIASWRASYTKQYFEQ